MHSNLLDVLVDRNIINADTEITARILSNDLSGVAHLKFDGTYNYIAHFTNDNGVATVIAESVRDGAQCSFVSTAITAIDGMDASRLASIYALSETGERLSVGARRGRKPKNRAA